jgi:hypothetical protein
LRATIFQNPEGTLWTNCILVFVRKAVKHLSWASQIIQLSHGKAYKNKNVYIAQFIFAINEMDVLDENLRFLEYSGELLISSHVFLCPAFSELPIWMFLYSPWLHTQLHKHMQQKTATTFATNFLAKLGYFS